MITGFRNALLNPGFTFWDYGAGPFTTSGYTATRWKLELTGAPGVSIAQGANDASASTPKWLRGRPNLAITVSSYTPASDTISVIQRMEEGERYGRQNLVLSGIVTGPAGAHFYVIINNQAHKIETQGDSGGVPILTHFSIPQVINDPATEFIPITIFTRPSGTGTFRILFAQLEFTEFASEPATFELRNHATERMLLNRYVYPVTMGHTFFATNTTDVATGINYPCKMRTTPTFRQTKVGSIVFMQPGSGGSFSNATPIYSTPSGTANSEFGVRFKIEGFTGLTAGLPYIVRDNVLGIFDADY